MRCKCCDAIMPPTSQTRAILVPHPTIEGHTTTMLVEEDFCSKCSSNYNMYQDSGQDDTQSVLRDMGLVREGFIDYD